MEGEKYPLYINGETAGEVRSKRDGLYTVFEFSAGQISTPAEIWLWGEGKSVYIGRLLSEHGEAKLTKKYTRSEMQSFPNKIERFCDRERKNDIPDKRPEYLWSRHRDGTLTCSRDKGGLIAIPSHLRREFPGVKKMMIDGREYIIFRY